MKLKSQILSVLFALSMGACSGPAKQEVMSDDEWPTLDKYHMTMAEAFHPYKDSANLEPARKLAAELAQSADAWAAEGLPTRVNNAETKALIEALKTGSHRLVDQVNAGAPNDSIGAALTALHNQFHHITEAWHGAEKHEH